MKLSIILIILLSILLYSPYSYSFDEDDYEQEIDQLKKELRRYKRDLELQQDRMFLFRSYPRSKDSTIQIYEDYTPKYGDFYEFNGNKWQRYRDYAPSYGDYGD